MRISDWSSDVCSSDLVIVPRKTVAELRRLVDGIDDPVEIALSDTKIRFAFGSTVLSSKLIDGTFPDYERVIPAGNDKVLEVDCKTFAEAVDRVRSEEHTSELQSLMRISYAVFRLKKKN